MNNAIRRSFGSAGTALVIVLSVALAALTAHHSREEAALRSQVEMLRAQLNNLEASPEQTKELERLRAQVREAAEFKKEAEEVHRLRGEVTQLRKDKTEFDQAKAENVQLRDQARQARRLDEEQVNKQLALENDKQRETILAFASGVVPKEDMRKQICIESLKYVDGAIQQWALESGKKAVDPVDWKGILSYLKGSVLPLCPSGGVYFPGHTVSAAPTCSVPGHTL